MKGPKGLLRGSSSQNQQDRADESFSLDAPLSWYSPTSLTEECVYHVCMDPSTPHPIAIFLEDADVASLAAVLKHILPENIPCIAVSLKTKRPQVQKLIRKSLQPASKGAQCSGVLVLSTDSALFVQSCLPPTQLCKSIVHATAPSSYESWKRRCSLLVPSLEHLNSNNIRETGTQIRVSAKPVAAAAAPTSTATPLPSAVAGKKRTATQMQQPTAPNQVQSQSQVSSNTYPYRKPWVPQIQARVSTSRKLCTAIAEAAVLRPANNNSLSSGGDFDINDIDFDSHAAGRVKNGGRGQDDNEAAVREKKQGLAGKIAALEARLKVLLAVELPGRISQSDALKQDPGHPEQSPAEAKTNTNVESTKTLRNKMLALGMLHEPDAVERAKQADAGRSLAVTRWIDGVGGTDMGLPWGDKRYGAAKDEVSLCVQDAVEACRLYITRRAGAGGRSGGLPKREAEASLAPKKLLRSLFQEARIVALGWRPSPFGDKDDWGGPYGKACGHNEVVLFYSRPFAPMEVLNTHCCSRASPAPGNEGHDGCLEFLSCQCSFFKRPQTVWDSTHFIFIDARGEVTSTPKSQLLRALPENELKVLVKKLRRRTVECGGTIPPQQLLAELQSAKAADHST